MTVPQVARLVLKALALASILGVGAKPSRLSAQTPVLTLPPTYVQTATVGVPFQISISASNSGPASTDGYISVSFPTLSNGSVDKAVVSSGSQASGEAVFEYAKGETIFNCANPPVAMVAQHLLVDFQDTNWGTNEQNNLTLTVTPSTTGTFTFRVRMALRRSDGTIGRAPSFTGTDQQGCYAQQYTVNVVAPQPDLSIPAGAVLNYPSQAVAGQAMQVSMSVYNGGAAATTRGFVNRLFMSSDQNLSTSSDADLGTCSIPGTIASLNTSPITNCAVTVPSGRAGTQYIIVRLDDGGVIAESNENNNIVAGGATTVTVNQPDLSLSIGTPPSSATPQQVIAVPVTVRNKASATASTAGFSRIDVELRLSSNATYGDGDDIQFSTLTGCNTTTVIAINGSTSFTCNMTVPSVPVGSYFVVGMVDPANAIPELLENADNRGASQLSMPVQAATGTLPVVVKNEAGQVVPGATVRLMAGVTQLQSLTSDNAGQVTFSNLDISLQYRVDVYSPPSQGIEYWGDAAVFSVVAGANAARVVSRREPWVSQVEMFIGGLPWTSEGTLVAGMNAGFSSSGGYRRLKFSVTNPPNSPARSGTLNAIIALNSGDTARVVGLPFTLAASASTPTQSFVDFDLGPAYPGVANDGLLINTFPGWPARGIEGAGYVSFAVRRAGLAVPNPVDSTVLEYGINFSSPCNASYALTRVLPDPVASPLIGNSGRSVVLVHGYNFGASGSGGACNPASPPSYFGLSGQPDVDDGNYWPEIVKRLHAEGTDVWTFTWATTTSLRAAGQELQRQLLANSGIKSDIVLFGHSMGGLVATHALSEGLGLRAGRPKMVSRVLTAGTPHNGSESSINLSSWNINALGLQFSAFEIRNAAYVAQRRRSITAADQGITLIAGGGDDQVIPWQSAYDLGGSVDLSLRYPVSSYSREPGSSTNWPNYSHSDLSLTGIQNATFGPRKGGSFGWPGSEFYDVVLGSLRRNAPSTQQLRIQGGGRGAGSGRIVSLTTPGIDCTITDGLASGPSCVWDVPSGQSVSLTVAAGSLIAWSGTGTGFSCPGSGACTVAMNQARTVTAAFSVPSKLAFAAQPTSTGSGQVLSQSVVIQLQDASNQNFAVAGIPVSLAVASGNGLLVGATTLTVPTDALGRATFTGLRQYGHGPHTLSATAPSLAGATSSSFNVPVNQLVAGTALTNLSGPAGSQAFYQISIPAGASVLDVISSAGAGNADLYVRSATPPTTASYDCVDSSPTNVEQCVSTVQGPATHYVMLNGIAAYSGVLLIATVNAAKPDLVAGNVSLSPTNPLTTQSVSVAVPISNMGNIPATGVSWQLKVDGTVAQTGSISSIASGGAATVSATLAAPQLVGAHTVQFVLDPSNLIAESDESNNASTGTFNASLPPTVDLLAGAVSMTPSNPLTTQAVAVSAVVTNLGNATASGVSWQLKLDGAVVSVGSIATLAPNGTSTITYSIAAPHVVGQHSVQLVLDPANAIGESDEGNNSSVASFTASLPATVDLVAGSIAFSPANPLTTQTVAVSASVTNSGNATATNVSWQLKLDGALVQSGVIPNIAAGATGLATGSLNAPLSIGQHTVQLIVDPANAIVESDETNNANNAVFSASPPLTVDLLSGAITVTPSNPLTTQSVALSALLTNVGNAVATNVAWQLKVDGAVVNSGVLPSLAAGAGTSVSASNLGPYASGSHTVQLVLDPANALVESSEVNNTSSVTFTASPPQTVDLVAGLVSPTPTNPLTSQTVNITAALSNAGNAAATNAAWQLKVDGAVVQSGTVTLAAGANTTVSATNLGPYAQGSHTVQLVLDPANALTESSESNNTSSATFTASPPQTVDLSAGTITLTPTNPLTTQAVAVSAAVSNTGNATATNAAWQLKVDGAVVQSGTVTLAAGANTTVSATNLGPYAQGSHTVQLVLDPANAIAESDETDNITTTTFTASLPQTVDLVAGAITRTPTNPLTTQTVTVTAAVSNAGNAPATNAAWQIKVDGAVVQSGTVTLAPGANTVVNAANLGPYPQGSHTVLFVVDPTNAVAESSEANNTSSVTFTATIPATPDLVAGALTVSPANPSTTQLVALSALVSNTGTAIATNAAWQLKVDGTVVQSGAVTLAAGANATVTASNLGPFVQGSHVVQLVVDPSNAIAESDEADNTSSASFTASPPQTADLVAGVVTVAPTNPLTTQTITVSAAFSNAGNATATNAVWQLKIDGAVVQSGTSTLAAGGNASVSAANVGPFTPGSHTVQIVLDPANAIVESSETNNVGATTFTASLPQTVDLTAGAISLTPTNPLTTQTVTVTAALSNTGNVTATGAVWQLRADGAVVKSGTVTLAAGANTTVTATNLGPFPQGSHTLQLVLDPSNAIVESDETDNISTTNFTASLPQTADLVAGAITLTPPNPLTTQTVSISAAFANAGNAQATNATWQLKVDGAVVKTGAVTLAAGANTSVSATNLGPYAQGGHTVQLVLDPANAIGESSEINNTSNSSFTSSPPQTIDLTAGIITLTPTNPLTTQAVAVTAALSNTGSASATNAVWQLRVDGALVQSGSVTLAAGANTTVSASNLGPYAQGSHTVQLVLDPANAIAESDETDNITSISFTASPPTTADLVAGVVTITPTSPLTTQTVTVSAALTNAGNVVAANAAWQLKIDGAVVQSGTVTLAPGAGTTVSATNLGPFIQGSHTVQLVLDPANLLVESSETNNTSSTAFTASPPQAVDLVAGAISLTPSNPLTTQSVTVSATIGNAGNATATNAGWQLEVDGLVVQSGFVTLAAGATTTVTATNTGPYAQGSHAVQLIVDRTNAISESSELNNSSSLSFTSSIPQSVDLVAGSVVISPLTPLTTERVSVSATVSNAGTATAINAAWQIKVDGSVVQTGTVTLSAGANTTIGVGNLGPYAQGEHSVQLVLDPANALVESSEVNNTSVATFTSIRQATADLVARTLQVVPASPTSATPITLIGNLQNLGDIDASNISWQLRIGANTVQSGIIGRLASGEMATVAASGIPALPAGQYTAQLEIDAVNTIEEASETNNVSSVVFTVSGAGSGVDLEAGAISISPELLLTTTPVTITAVMRNVGTSAATSTPWLLMVDGALAGSGSVTLGAGASTTVVVQNLGPYAVGVHSVQLVVDPGNVIQESSESNNVSGMSFTVLVNDARAELSPGIITLSPTTPRTGDAVSLTAEIANTGSAPASNVSWQFKVDGVPVGAGAVPTLQPGAKAIVTVQGVGPFALGTHTAEIVVDAANSISEVDESNNVRTLTFSTGERSIRLIVSGAPGRIIRIADSTVLCIVSPGVAESVCSLSLAVQQHVSAEPTAATGFVGWTGACTGRGTCTVLSTETQDLRANFQDVPTILADVAARDLLSGSGLSLAQRDVLDRTGNGDGVYNLGDLLAHLERTNQTLSNEVSSQLLKAPASLSRPTRQPAKRIPRN